MRGWLEVEFVVDCAGRPWVLEINPRICGTMRLAAMCAQVAVFDIPAVETLDGPLPAVAVGAEVPWAGEPIADPRRHRFATSRLTICAADADELHAELTALGIDLEAHTQIAGVRDYAQRLRRGILTMVDGAKGGHPGSSLSAADAIAVLFHRLIQHADGDPRERDRFFLSKGHAAPALYAGLVLEGVLPLEDLGRLRVLGSPLQGHPDPRFLPALEAPSGSLAQGASTAVGAALGLWRRGSLARVYALLGDGECQEGQVWEAASFAAHQGLANLTFVIDRNGLQHDAPVAAIAGRTDLAEVWRAFGWEVFVVDGHDHEALEAALRGTPGTRPTAVIADTIKGKGVPFMENDIHWHSVHDPARLAEALALVGGPLT
jgi:transketolase